MNAAKFIAALFLTATSSLPATAGIASAFKFTSYESQSPDTADGRNPAIKELVYGYKFTATAPVTITALSYFDHGGDGLLGPHSVGLWSADGNTMLASAVVQAGTASPILDSFRYTALATPVALSPGATYLIGGTAFSMPLSPPSVPIDRFVWNTFNTQTLAGIRWETAQAGLAPAFGALTPPLTTAPATSEGPIRSPGFFAASFVTGEAQKVCLAWNRMAPKSFIVLPLPFGSSQLIAVDGGTPAFPVNNPVYRESVKAGVDAKFKAAGVILEFVDEPGSDTADCYFLSKSDDLEGGVAYTGLDTYNENEKGGACVFIDDSYFSGLGVTYAVDAVAHELGHLFGLPHINGPPTEIMQYHGSLLVQPTAFSAEPYPLTGFGEFGDHNPVYHIRRYVEGQTASELQELNIRPGSYDTGSLAHQLIRIIIESPGARMFNVSVLKKSAQPVLVRMAHFDEITARDLAALTFRLLPGERMALIGASLPGGPLDVALASGDPFASSESLLVSPGNAFVQRQTSPEGGYVTLAGASLAATPGTVKTLNSWLAAFALFGAEAVPAADPDHDGADNLLEYAFSGHPLQAGVQNFPYKESADGSLVFQRDAEARDLTYEVEISGDLAVWQTAARSAKGDPAVTLLPGMVSTLTDSGHGFAVVKITFNSDPSARFSRVRVHKESP